MTAPLILRGKVEHVAHASQWSDHLRRVAITLSAGHATAVVLVPSEHLQRGQAVTITIAVDGEDQE